MPILQMWKLAQRGNLSKVTQLVQSGVQALRCCRVSPLRRQVLGTKALRRGRAQTEIPQPEIPHLIVKGQHAGGRHAQCQLGKKM